MERGVSYGATYIVEHPCRLATVSVGYADGYARSLSNKGWVLIHGQKAPIVGNICMDVTLIDVTDIPCKEGDRVEIFGEQLPVTEIARIIDTIPYEILTSVSSRVKRVYYRE